MNQYYAVLMDVVSIQKYVFSSNELRDNLGASHIVNTLFDDLPIQALAETCHLDTEEVRKIIVQWKKNPDKILLDDDPSAPFEVGVFSGGKALILFREESKAKEFVKKFTKELLLKAPGIHLAVAIMEGFMPNQNFPGQIAELYARLMDNHNRYFLLQPCLLTVLQLLIMKMKP